MFQELQYKVSRKQTTQPKRVGVICKQSSQNKGGGGKKYLLAPQWLLTPFIPAHRRQGQEDLQVPAQPGLLIKCLMIRAIQTETTLRFHHAPIRRVRIQKQMTTSAGEEVRRWGNPICTAGGCADCYSHYGNPCGLRHPLQ